MNKLVLYTILVFCLFWQSCEKDITVDLPQPLKSVVIEGAIETGRRPWVIVTRNIPYFAPVDSAALMNMLVLNAIVTVTDGIVVDTLKPVLDMDIVPPFKYVGSRIKGEERKRYILTVKVDNKLYSASTTIPPAVQLDSLTFRLRNPAENDSLGYLWIHFRDPDSLGNFYRIFTRTIGKDSVFVHPFASVADDAIINGQRVDYMVYRGRNPNIQRKPGEEEDPAATPRWAFVKGERAIMKFCSIDQSHFEFWKTIEQEMSGDGNPFSSPASIKTNIEGGALGIWGGYGVYLDTILIPE